MEITLDNRKSCFIRATFDQSQGGSIKKSLLYGKLSLALLSRIYIMVTLGL